MGKKTLIISLAMVALSGCRIPTFSNKETPKENTPKPAVKVRDEVVFTKPNTRSSQAESNVVSVLIATTNAEERRETVVKGRNDPFRPIDPIVTIKRTAPLSPLEVRLPPPPKVRLPPPLEVRLPPPPKVTPTPPPKITPNPPPKVTPTPPPKIRQPPLPPQPLLAREVAVTGLIQVGAVTKIIVKSPLEKYSRYVEQGQYLANGKVLVKRIETGGGKPIVVLEQLGIEVIKRVGDKVAKPEEV